MKFTIIVGTKDLAGMNIKEQLLKEYEFKEDLKLFGNTSYVLDNIHLVTVDKKTLMCENIDQELDTDLIIFATRHLSKSGEKTLCCHTPGNWAEADFGGKPGGQCISPALFLKHIFKILNNNGKSTDSMVTMEVTHHGPYLETPAIFIEIGSTEEEWTSKNKGRVIAQTIIDAIKIPVEKFTTAIGIGGPHYCNNFNDIQLSSDFAIGHIIPKYVLEKIDPEIIKKAINRTVPKPEFALLDWKGLGKEKQKIVTILENLKCPYKRTKDI